MKSFIFVFFFIFCHFVFAFTETIAIIADSIGTAYPMNDQYPYPRILQDLLRLEGHNIKVINDSIAGSVTASGPERLSKILEQHHPDIAILNLGVNDGLTRVPVRRFKDQLATMIQMALDQNVKVIIGKVDLAAYPFVHDRVYARHFNHVYSDLAKQYPQVIFYPYLWEGFVSKASYSYDGLHPNKDGHRLMAFVLRGYLDPFLKKQLLKDEKQIISKTDTNFSKTN